MKTIVLLLLIGSTLAANPESYYRDQFAAKIGGKVEVTAPDRTRCDILTETHAIEVDWSHKWAEAIGQSLNYAFQFDRRAGIVLILKKPKDRRHLIRVESIIRHYKLPIDVWEVRAWEIEKRNSEK